MTSTIRAPRRTTVSWAPSTNALKRRSRVLLVAAVREVALRVAPRPDQADVAGDAICGSSRILEDAVANDRIGHRLRGHGRRARAQRKDEHERKHGWYEAVTLPQVTLPYSGPGMAAGPPSERYSTDPADCITQST